MTRRVNAGLLADVGNKTHEDFQEFKKRHFQKIKKQLNTINEEPV